MNTAVATLESRGLAARVIRRLGLEDDPEFLKDAIEGTPEPSSDGRLAGGNSAVGELRAAPPEASTERSRGEFLAKLNTEAVLSSISAALESARSFLTSAWAGDADGNLQVVKDPLGDDRETGLLLDEAGERKAVALLDQFLERLWVEPEEKSTLISISFTLKDAQKAALIANKLVDEYMQSQLEAKI